MHWTVWQEDKPFVPNLDKFGFVYIITNTKTGKAYVGCKQYFSMTKKKRKHNWETYTGSSKYLNADIEKDGKEKFKFEVIAEYKNKRSLRYYEAYYQMKWNVLTATMKDSDDPAFYNSYVGGKWYRPIENAPRGEEHWTFGKPRSEKTRKLISETKLGVSNIAIKGEKNNKYQGKAEFYLDGKRMEVHCLGAWCNENGYSRNGVAAIARTTRDGFTEGINIKGGPKIKRRSFSCKGPLGTITKVKWIGKEVKDVSQESNV